jgi:PAS domain S-box-containing protein
MPNEDLGKKIRDIVQQEVDYRTRKDRRRTQRDFYRQRKPRDPLRGLFWGLLFVLLGVLLFASQSDWLNGSVWWEVFATGLGAIFIIDALVHYWNPSSRSYTLGRLIPGLIFLCIGLAFLFGFTQWWPLALVAIGVSIFFSSWVLQREIEKRRITQETLYQSEEKYQHIIDNANSIIMEMDTRGNIIFLNKFAQQFFGYQESEILGKNVVGTIIGTNDPLRQAFLEMCEDIAVHPEKYLHNERENTLRNGSKVWITWTNKPIFDEENNLKEILCIGIDSTERKKAEETIAQQLKEKTAAEERNRLARDLHDAVSQTLFSTTLIADVLPRLWERNQEEGRKRLEEVRQLTRGALAEMRTLLLELRPSALTDAELGDLLKQLSDSINGRARIPVRVEVKGHYDLPTDVKIGFYRIAQEALNNVAKHSSASQASVLLDYLPQGANLIIADDGKGFDLENIQAKSLGVGIMRERAREIKAHLSIESQVGQGTRISVGWGEGIIS